MRDVSDEAGRSTTKGSVVYPQVSKALAKLGRDISLARRTRRVAAADFSRQMGVSRATLHRLESGDPGISLNTLTMAMFVLGNLDRLAELADPARDDVALMLTRRNAPRRVRRHQPTQRPGDAAEHSGDTADDHGYEGW